MDPALLDIDITYLRPANNARPVRLTWQGPPHNQFRKVIGTRVGRDGKVRPRVFLLGRDLDVAQHLARSLLAIWGLR